MWEHYRQTFARVQLAIGLTTVGVYFWLHRLWFIAAVFFLVMQVGSLVGAAWAARLKRMLTPQSW